MAVTLAIAGVDPRGIIEKHTVPDGATIAVRRTHDGFLSIVINPPEPAPIAGAAAGKTDRGHAVDLSDRAVGGIVNGYAQKMPPGHDRNEVLERLREAPDLAAAVAREINILRERQQNGHKQLFSEIMATKDHASQAAAQATHAAITDLLKTGVRISMDLAADVAAEEVRG